MVTRERRPLTNDSDIDPTIASSFSCARSSAAAFVYTTFWMRMPFHDSNAQCSKPRAELVSPTVTDVTITCTPDPRWAQSGYHRTMPTVRDALGNERNHEVVIYLYDPLPG